MHESCGLQDDSDNEYVVAQGRLYKKGLISEHELNMTLNAHESIN